MTFAEAHCVVAVSAKADDYPQVSLMRAARTDAGVSAAINVLNIKLILNPPGLPEGTTLTEHINSFLPAAVRIWNIIRVQNGFHSRTMCDSRMYNYSLPTYCFLEPRPETAMGKRVSLKEGETNWWDDKPAVAVRSKKDPTENTSGNDAERTEDAAVSDVNVDVGRRAEMPEVAQQPQEPTPSGDASMAEAKPAVEENEEPVSADPPPLSAFREDQLLRKTYRITPDGLKRLRDTINAFKGSHNFWNFTVGKEFGDRSCQRVMKNLTVSIWWSAPLSASSTFTDMLLNVEGH